MNPTEAQTYLALALLSVAVLLATALGGTTFLDRWIDHHRARQADRRSRAFLSGRWQ